MSRIVVLEDNAQLPDAWTQADDWRGVTSTAERKKRQNRINQRAYRRRKEAGQGQITTSSRLLDDQNDGPTSEVAGALQRRPKGIVSGGPLLMACPYKTAKARELLDQAYEDHRLGTVRPMNLHIMIRLNALNALARNAVAMGFPPEGLCRDEYVSPYNQLLPVASPHQLSLSAPVPDSLQSTNLQRRIPHHPWIDLFPFPRFRENMLHAMAVGALDEDELCMDMLEVDDSGDNSKPVFLVWGESWDNLGWEASVAFLRKWGWLLRGCPEIIEGTNRWRQQRGEKRLIFNVS